MDARIVERLPARRLADVVNQPVDIVDGPLVFVAALVIAASAFVSAQRPIYLPVIKADVVDIRLFRLASRLGHRRFGRIGLRVARLGCGFYRRCPIAWDGVGSR